MKLLDFHPNISIKPEPSLREIVGKYYEQAYGRTDAIPAVIANLYLKQIENELEKMAKANIRFGVVGGLELAIIFLESQLGDDS